MALHAHVSIESRDCDGRYSRTYVVLSTMAGEDEGDFRASVIGNALAYEDDGTTVTFSEDGFTIHETTEEGYNTQEFTWCEDDDATAPSTFRDHSAEAMGY